MTVKEFKTLKIGDRIYAKENTWTKSKGVFGTIVNVYINMSGQAEITIKWDKDVNGWGSKNNCEYMSEYGLVSSIQKVNANKTTDNNNNVFRLVIECKDGINTTATYTINDKVVKTSKTRRNADYDDFNFNVAVDNCIDRLKNKKTKGKELIGQHIQEGQRVRIINIDIHKSEDFFNNYVCLDEYVGKTGTVRYDFVVQDNNFGASITFDEEYMNAIDKKNGKLCYHYTEFELLDDGE